MVTWDMAAWMTLFFDKPVVNSTSMVQSDALLPISDIPNFRTQILGWMLIIHCKTGQSSD